MKNYLKLAEAFSRWENGEVPLFNGDLTGWNGDSSGWDVSAVTDMSGMFAGVTDLSRRENDMSEQALDEGERIMDEKTLIGMRLEYGALYQMHLRLAHGTKSDQEERLEHLDLASAYEIGLRLVERLLDY